MSRVRRVSDQKGKEKAIDELTTRGYRIKSNSETSARLKERDWGDAGTHLFLVLITGWWTFGLFNSLYAIYAYATAEEIVIKLDGDLHDDE